jgi:hypothetical protein
MQLLLVAAAVVVVGQLVQQVVHLAAAVEVVSLWVGQEFQHLHLALSAQVEQVVLDKQAVVLEE